MADGGDATTEIVCGGYRLRPAGVSQMIDVREEIATATVGSYHRFLALLIGMVVFFDGYDTFNPAYVIHYVAKPWHLAPSQAGLLVSSGLIGFMIGSLLQGKFSDRYGRRATLLAALWIVTLFSFATAALGRSFYSFCALRLLTGLGMGALLPLGVTYVNEYAPRRLANTFSMWGWALGWAAGGIVAAAIGIYLTPMFGWQALYYAASLSIVLVVICHAALPESLQFSAMRGDWKGIAETLSRLNPSRSARYQAAGAQFIFPEPSDRPASVSLLLSPRYRRTTAAVWTSAFFILFGIWGLSGWVPTAMMQRGEGFAASFGFGALIQAMAFVGSLVCGFIADREGKDRQAMAAWWLGGCISVGVLVLVNVHALNIICVGAAGFCILGGQNVLNNFTAASYDTEVRGTAVGMMLGVGRAGGILGPFITGLLQQHTPGTAGLFVAIGAASLIGGVAILFANPKPAHELAVSAEAVHV
ncbi:MAG TPA: MFS transporter [Candidatus Acidoferrales bacterium]|nr:MFS transporter [Candidatus Acidoferrales bacterium]